MSFLQINQYELLPFDLAAKPTMDRYLASLNLDTSDYTFAANYLWLSGGSGFYSVIENTFCFFLLTNGELSMLLPPIGKQDDVIKAITICFNLMEENNSAQIYTKIDYVDEFIASVFVNELEEGAELFDLLEDYVIERTLVDYVYDCVDLIELKGNAFSAKRNEINKFKRINPSYEVDILDTNRHTPGIMELLNKWISDRMKYLPVEQTEAFLDGIHSERIAVKRMLNDYEKLNLIGLVIIIDGKVKGFTVGEKINVDTASVIIEKTDFDILGCAQFIFREFAKKLAAEYGVSHINVGDDMGFENLKKVKMSYRPSKLIPKYTIYKR
ncbi:DUF2156 domain-containing protein [Spartinivicinus ruber]|uniref:DUF2156 domain-containing protein n=1 Tax=Spartinivicinus ruber TaxID=2683272 RepID=UPI0013D5A540|nr:phosphatidylglycerol lysyltransferase domain-containing protein [Spartinivicinus ruber]